MARETEIKEISDHVMLLFPLIKRLLKAEPGESGLAPFRNQSFQVLRVLQRRGPLPMSAIGARLYIAKQNMTTLIDRLEGEGLVGRTHDPLDRRIVTIAATPKGIRFLDESTTALKRIVERNLSVLSDADITAFNEAVRTMRRIFTAFDEGDSHASD